MPKSLYIIDGHAHIYAAYYAPMRQKLTSPAGEPTKATFIFTNMLLGLIERKRPDMLVLAMDSKTPSFRTKLYPEYKAHRPPMPDDMPQQIDRIEQIVSAMNIPIIRCDGFEADDVIGTLARRAAAKNIDAYICSKDKDMLQLLGRHTFTYDIKNDEITTAESMKEKLGIGPEHFIDVLALQGDASDNVPGVPDVGPKTAMEWIKQYGSLENLYKHADEIKGSRGENLRKSRDLAELSRKLVIINTDAPVKFDEKQFAVKEYDSQKLSEVFSELDFTRMLGQLGLETAKLAKQQELFGEPESQADSGKIISAKTIKHDYRLINSPQDFEQFAADLKKQDKFAFDTETTGTDPTQAELVGMSFCWKAHQAYYLPLKGPMGVKCLDKKMVAEKLTPVLADEKIKKIGQNIKYDMIIMHFAKMPLAGIYFDTMIASYVLDADRHSHSMDAMAADFLNYKTIPLSDLIGKGKKQTTFDTVDLETACEYSAEDADVTWQLYEYFNDRLEKQPSLKKLFDTVEMPLVEALAKMEINGVSLDAGLLRKMSIDIAAEIEKTADKIYALAGGPFNIDSPKQLAEILFDRLQLPGVRVGKAGRSTDAGVLEELKNAHPIVALVLEYRTLSKLQNTYVDKLGSLINPRTGRVHTSFNQTVTATGRLSSSDPNLQNIPIRTEIGRKIRAAFVPQSKDFKILSADYSQIELRFLAHFSQDRALCRAFADDMDIHAFVASQIYGVPLEKVTGEMRSHCKAVNFGLIYGQGAFGLSQTTGLSQAQAKKFIDQYFQRYNSIKSWIDSVVKEAAKTGYAETILGRRRKIENLTSREFQKKSQAQRLVVNTIIQGSAADLIKLAMINIHKRIEKQSLPVKMILQIHDELVFEVPAKQAEKDAQWIVNEMSEAIKLSVPLKVDTTIGDNWLE